MIESLTGFIHHSHIGMRLFAMLTIVLAHYCPANAQNYPGDWQARWIWMPGGEPRPFHYFLMTRGTFDLQSVPSEAAIKITAANRYMLYVNGQYVGRGPARSDPRWKSYDTREIASLLRPGRNVIAILGYYYGASNNISRDERAGIFAQLEMKLSDGQIKIVGTDEDWRVRQAAGWDRNVGHVSQHHGALGMTEVYNANADPPDWTQVDFNDASWSRAMTLPPTGDPAGFLEPRQTPLLEENEIFPERVVKVGEAMQLNRIGEPNDIPTRMAAEFHKPLEFSTVQNPDAVLAADGQSATITSGVYRPGDPMDRGVRSPLLIVDFGRPVFGFPQVRLNAPANAVIDMTYGSHPINDRVPAIVGGLRMGDRYITRSGDQVWQTFEYKQFRYLQIVLRNCPEPVSMDSISVVAYRYPAPRVGAFECSDPILNRLWRACIETTYLSMEDVLICDATRERRVFTGDGSHGLFGIYSGFGDLAISDWYFRLIARGAMTDGMLRTTYPGTEQPSGGGDLKALSVAENPIYIPQSALVYSMMAGLHFENMGPRPTIEEIYPALSGLVNWCIRHADPRGLLNNLPGWNWLDWSVTDMRGANFQTNALYYRTLLDMNRIALALGLDKDAQRWRDEAVRVHDALREGGHWNDSRGLFADSAHEDSEVFTEVANGMALLWGIATPEQTQRIIENFHGADSAMAQPSPLYHHYVVEGLIAAGTDDLALELLSKRFAPMMEFMDPPTVWESFMPYVRPRGALFTGEMPSYVHTGGVGPAWTLSTKVLGIQSAAPGFERCRIQPSIGNLKWAKGTFPSVKGPIGVEWERDDDSFTLVGRLPDGLETEFVMADPGWDSIELTHNGDRIEPAIDEDSERKIRTYRVATRGGGAHTIVMRNGAAR